MFCEYHCRCRKTALVYDSPKGLRNGRGRVVSFEASTYEGSRDRYPAHKREMRIGGEHISLTAFPRSAQSHSQRYVKLGMNIWLFWGVFYGLHCLYIGTKKPEGLGRVGRYP